MFVTPEIVKILDQIIDDAQTLGNFSEDQATIVAVRISLHALSTSLVEAYKNQGSPELMVVSPMMIHSLIDMVLWMNDRLELSMLGIIDEGAR